MKEIIIAQKHIYANSATNISPVKKSWKITFTNLITKWRVHSVINRFGISKLSENIWRWNMEWQRVLYFAEFVQKLCSFLNITTRNICLRNITSELKKRMTIDLVFRVFVYILYISCLFTISNQLFVYILWISCLFTICNQLLVYNF